MGGRWQDIERLLVSCAEDDLRASGEVTPALAAFAGDQPQFLAWMRPFPPGGYQGPIVELLALAMPLNADRLMLAVAGRAWSMVDPIPPVTEDADLRQRTLMLHVVDGSGGRMRCSSILHPFDLAADGTLVWGERRELGVAQGWIVSALQLAVRQRGRLTAGTADLRAQAERVVRLGHQLYVDPDIAQRLALDTGVS